MSVAAGGTGLRSQGSGGGGSGSAGDEEAELPARKGAMPSTLDYRLSALDPRATVAARTAVLAMIAPQARGGARPLFGCQTPVHLLAGLC